mmetsp:Transcript_730/g.1876  ORF Transcript_730/g.1876 Transcript_730/m.1876 type:complete len:295 (-) Transcript_730:114-998(-)
MAFCPCCSRHSYVAASSNVCRFSSSSIFPASSAASVPTMTSGGMQLTMSSYSLPRTTNKFRAVCSRRMSPAISLTYISQSGRITSMPSVRDSPPARTASASIESSARRMFRRLLATMRAINPSGTASRSSALTRDSNATHSAVCGAPTRTSKHRLRNGSITLLTLLQHSTNRHALAYFSIVRRSPACASLESLSTSFSISILYVFSPDAPIGRDLAISLMISCTTYRSFIPTSDGLISMWYAELTVANSISFVEPEGNVIFQGLYSTWTFDAAGPYSSRSIARMSVFLPAPVGP